MWLKIQQINEYANEIKNGFKRLNEVLERLEIQADELLFKVNQLVEHSENFNKEFKMLGESLGRMRNYVKDLDEK